MMSSKTLLVGLLLSVGLNMPAHAERGDHFKGKPSETLEQALVNFNQSNAQLEALLKKPKLEGADMATIHQLTYTLENALEKIDDELERASKSLEQVHLASEKADAPTVRTQGKKYLDLSRKIIR